MPIGHDVAELLQEIHALKGENASLKKDMATFSDVVRQLNQYKVVAEGHWAAIGELRVAKDALATAQKEADALRSQLAEATAKLEAKGLHRVTAAPVVLKNRGNPESARFMALLIEEERKRAIRCCWAASYLCTGTAKEAASLIASGGGYAPENLIGADALASKALADFLAEVKPSTVGAF